MGKKTSSEKEVHTIELMVRLYCRKVHGTVGGPCPACEELLDYARERIDRCPYLPDKPTCRQCPVHCFNTIMREKVAEVMRFSGPRMMLYHPVEAIRHLLREWKAQ